MEMHVVAQLKKTVPLVIDSVKWESTGITWNAEDVPTGALRKFGFSSDEIGFFFVTLFAKLNEPIFLFLVSEIRQFENTQWIDSLENWGDWNAPIFTLEEHDIHIKKYENRDDGFFTEPKDSLAKTLGICRARLKAWELTGDRNYHTDYLKAHKKLSQSDQVYDMSVNVDIDSESVDQLREQLTMSLHEVKSKIISSRYKRTLKIFNEAVPDKLREYTEQAMFSQVTFLKFIESNLSSIPSSHRKMLSDILKYEKRINEMNSGITCKALHHAQNLARQIYADRIVNLQEPDFLSMTLEKIKGLKIVHPLWNWSEFDSAKDINTLSELPPNHVVVFHPITKNNIKELLISDITLFILNMFAKPISIKQALTKFLRSIKLEDVTEEQAKEYFLDSVRFFIIRCVLLESTNN